MKNEIHDDNDEWMIVLNNLNKILTKDEKHYEMITVHPKKGQPFKRRQLVGRKEEERKFAMSEKDANIWTKDSIYKDYVYHGTTVENAKGIESGGFSDNKVGKRTGNAGMYGRGFYFGMNKGSASGFAEGPQGLLKIKINVKKLCDLKCWEKLDKKYKLWDIFEEDDMEGPTKVRNILMKEGYDGVHVTSEMMPSYGEICIFDPKNIMVIK